MWSFSLGRDANVLLVYDVISAPCPRGVRWQPGSSNFIQHPISDKGQPDALETLKQRNRGPNTFASHLP